MEKLAIVGKSQAFWYIQRGQAKEELIVFFDPDH